MGEYIVKLENACRAVLLFHKGGPWEPTDFQDWQDLTNGCAHVTTKALCDTVRAALGVTEGGS